MLDLGPIGTRFRDITLLGGTGPMLYRATHTALGHPVLIKVMPRLSDGASAQAALFLRGARAAARLDHPHIVRVYDLTSGPTADILVQEFVDGPTLDEVLRALPDGRLPVEQAFAIATDLAAALAVAHTAGLVHRNLSPSAVSLTRAGAVKLSGFEAASRTPDPDGSDPWDADPQLGNPLYTAPEQARDGTVTPRSDVYSLGALLYRMLTGRPPIVGNSAAALQYKKQRDDPPPPSRARNDLPAGVDELVRRLLARNPAERPGDMTEARDAFRRLAAPAPAPERDRRDDVLLNYPTPIAQSYARVWREWDWGVRRDGLFELVEAVVKYCAVAAVLAASDARGQSPPPHLEQLHRPSFGVWLSYLRAAVELPRGASPFVDQMRDTLYAGPVGRRVSDLLQEVVQDRNAAFHGRARRPTPDDDTPYRELLPKAHDLLASLRWLTEFPLVQIHDIDNLDDSDDDPHPYLIRYRLCAGVVPSVGPENQVRLARRVGKNRLGLLDTARRTFLDLAPFVRYARCPVCAEDDVFVYNGMPDDRKVVLMSCHGPHEFEEETTDDPFAKRGIVWSH
jgi:hypothetical protein